MEAEVRTSAGSDKIRLWQRYADTFYGRDHAASPPRYSQRYGYDREQMLRDLGDDVHPVSHMLHTDLNILSPLIFFQNKFGKLKISPVLAENLHTTAQLHDIGECSHPLIEQVIGDLVGDVHYEDKNAEHEAKERLIRHYLYDQIFDDVPRRRLEAMDAILDDPKSVEGHIFNTVERTGYYLTAMRAGELALKLLQDETAAQDHRSIMLGRLAWRVSWNHHDELTDRAEDFPYIEKLLEKHDATFRQIKAQIPEYDPNAEAAAA